MEMYSALQKKADYLYSMTFIDYVFDTEEKTIKSSGQASGGFGCSSVRKDNFYGRNFDFIFNDVPEFIVRVNKNEKIKHSSIGVATHFGLRESEMSTYGYGEQKTLCLRSRRLLAIFHCYIINFAPQSFVCVK